MREGEESSVNSRDRPWIFLHWHEGRVYEDGDMQRDRRRWRRKEGSEDVCETEHISIRQRQVWKITPIVFIDRQTDR